MLQSQVDKRVNCQLSLYVSAQLRSILAGLEMFYRNIYFASLLDVAMKKIYANPLIKGYFAVVGWPSMLHLKD